MSVTRPSGTKPYFSRSLRISFNAAFFRVVIAPERQEPRLRRRPPAEPELFAANQHGHLVEMPPRSRPMARTAKLPGKRRPEFQYPSSHQFVGDIQTALGEQIFHIAVAEGKTKVEARRVPDDRGGRVWRANEIVLVVIRYLPVERPN